MSSELDLPAGPVADRLTLWPVDDGRYGLVDNSWSLRFGPLTALEVGRAISAFVR